MNEEIKKIYELWKSKKLIDSELNVELEKIENDIEAINDRFYKNLEFGTAGLRGVLGAGTNRMNVYTVAKATLGFAKYLLKLKENPSIAIAYDSRNKSDLFAKIAASIMAKCGIKVYLWKELMPTPSLSFAVRYFKCDGGIVVTASHNPAKYNGYKVYGEDGCQISTEVADKVLEYINTIDIFEDFSYVNFDEAINTGSIEIISEDVFDAYLEAVSKESLASSDLDKSVKIAYTPLYGTGLRSVTEVLKRNGYNNVFVVEEQAKPNGNFPTAPYPNPEIREALELGLELASKIDADLLLATDPDCDRVGIAVRNEKEYTLISGNQVGVLLLDYICKRRLELGKMPNNPITVKTIVTTDMVELIAKEYGIECIDVLTGFKFIGGIIGDLEEKKQEDRYILGFEESYGYLTGTMVRDKDAVNASLIIAEMFAYYKSFNKSLIDILNELYEKYGYYKNSTYSFEFEGQAGMEKMNKIMEKVRIYKESDFASKKILKIFDYDKSLERNLITGQDRDIDLPKSNVIKFILEDNASVIFRPSGTEPKLKIYIGVNAENELKAKELEEKIYNKAKEFLN